MIFPGKHLRNACETFIVPASDEPRGHHYSSVRFVFHQCRAVTSGIYGLFLHFIDLFGTFVFALSGAIVGVRHRFDLFGVFALASVTAIGGGCIRDICLGATPRPGLLISSTFSVSFWRSPPSPSFRNWCSRLRNRPCFSMRSAWVFRGIWRE